MIPLDRDPSTPTTLLEADPRSRVVDLRRQGDADGDGSAATVAATAVERSTRASDSGE